MPYAAKRLSRICIPICFLMACARHGKFYTLRWNSVCSTSRRWSDDVLVLVVGLLFDLCSLLCGPRSRAELGPLPKEWIIEDKIHCTLQRFLEKSEQLSQNLLGEEMIKTSCCCSSSSIRKGGRRPRLEHHHHENTTLEIWAKFLLASLFAKQITTMLYFSHRFTIWHFEETKF